MPRTFNVVGAGVTILLDTITETGGVQPAVVAAGNTYSLDFSDEVNSMYWSFFIF